MAERMVPRIQALGDPNRLRILDALREGERCVCRLTETLHMGQPLLSHHLKVLREVGLVAGRKEGRWVHHSIIPEALLEIEAFLAEIREDALAAEPLRDRC
jgi:ArsR family transcriptional regulator